MNDLRIKNRIESKFIISNHVKYSIIDILETANITQFYHVCSDYYETINRDFLLQKKEGNFQKIKLRKRVYNNDTSFFEVKVKNGEVSFKQRFINISCAWSYIQSISLQKTSTLIPYPLTRVEYNRAAIDVNKGLRLTFDSNIVYKDLMTCKVDATTQYCILEVKSLSPPDWLIQLLHKKGLKQEPFSKYHEAHERTK